MDEEENEPKSTLSEMLESTNIAEKLDEEDLVEIGQDAKRGFEQDQRSREEWEKNLENWTKLAKQTVEQKTFPWPKASNIKFPLLSTAAMQFAARAYPSLVPSDGQVVKARIIGKDLDGSKTQTAKAVSLYMSYQLLEEMDGWEEDMDKLLIMLPIVGTVFKKTYFDSVKKKNVSRLVLPKNLVVDYWAKSLVDAERISEVFEINPRVVQERINAGMWLDVDLGDPSLAEHDPVDASPGDDDDTTPYVFIEQHTYLDLDDDGYKEPYIVTFHKATEKVVRIVARYDDKTMYTSPKDGKVIKIEPIQYYTKFGFVPNPDGSFYDIGFGVLLGPINESVNTLINQLVDSGTLNNLQSGFIGKGLRLRMGATSFTPGEWKVVNSTGDDLKKQIVPMPAREPSKVLLELMNILVTSGKELASVAEIFVGKMPGQNTPATTTMASIEQGMKVFTAVYKRVYRALSEEFVKLYRLNSIYLDPSQYKDVVDMEVGQDDFQASTHKIYPGADPTAVSQQEKQQKAEALLNLLQTGCLDVVEVVRRVLEAQEQPNPEKLLSQQVQQTGQPPPPPPDPKVMALQAKSELDQQAGQQKIQLAERTQQLKEHGATQDLQSKAAEAQITHSAQAQQAATKIAAQVQADKARMYGAANQHHQDMQHSQELHQVKLKQAKEMPKKGPTKK